MTYEDRYGLPLTASGMRVVDAYVEGVDRLLSAREGADRCFRLAVDADPGFALGHVGLARALQLRMEIADARESATRARALLRHVTAREKGHVETIARAIEGDAAGALAAVAAHGAAYPRDALVLHLNFGAFGLISFAGRADHDAELLAFLDRFAGDYGDDWWFVFAHAWAHTEAGRVAEGHRRMDHAFALNPRNANAVHGIAHAFYEEGDPDGGAAFVRGFLPGYEPTGSLHCHLTWHLALFALVRGDVAAARRHFDDGIRARVAPQAPPANVMTDGASLLWRFLLDGERVEPGDWDELAAHARRAFPATAPHFHELHCAMAWAATGDWARFDERLAALRERVARGTLTPGPVVPALVEGLGAFARGDYAAAVRAIEPHAKDIIRVGGSKAQQDVFDETLIAAWLRMGESGKAAEVLRARLDRRPSPRAAQWLARALAA